jgi:hypothetical protein
MSTFAVPPGARLRFLSRRTPETTLASPWEAVAPTIVNDELPELAAVTLAEPSACGLARFLIARLTWTVPPPASGPGSKDAV